MEIFGPDGKYISKRYRKYKRYKVVPKEGERRALCHPERRYFAKDMCIECYDKAQHKRNYKNLNQERKRARAKIWYANNKDYMRLREIARKFNLSPEEYKSMLEQQQGLCALCGKPPRFREVLCVDHCHVQHKSRALLCVTCNAGLGQFYDDPELLEKAARYLREHQLVQA